jgi:DNA-binding GntR family transcriptional regulator
MRGSLTVVNSGHSIIDNPDKLTLMAMNKLEDYLNKQGDRFDNPSQLRRDLAYIRIKDAIQHADLMPGEPLSEMRLSKVLGLSRTPIREALQQLAQEGLVQVIPGQAVTVASPSLPDVLNAVHMRALLEPELARLVAEIASAETKSMLVGAVDDMESAIKTGDFAEWGQANNAYHQTMAESCPNQLLAEIVLQMYDRVHHLANIDSQTNPQRLAECTLEHRRIVSAIASNDPPEAEAAMKEHIVALRNSLFKRLSYGHH